MTAKTLAHGLMPLADRLGVQPLFGDIHNHCDLSYGHGRFADALATTDLPTQNEIDVLRELKRVTEAAHSQSENAQ